MMGDDADWSGGPRAAVPSPSARQVAFQIAVAWELTQELCGAVDATHRILAAAAGSLDAEWRPFAVENDGQVFDWSSQDFVTALDETQVLLDELRTKMHAVAENIVRSLEVDHRALAIEARARLGDALVEQRDGTRPALETAMLRYLSEST